jgi:hypothetical protein
MAKGKAKVPRKVAGVKVPKAVRKSGLLDELLTSELGRESLAEALVAAAGAVASVLVKNRPSSHQIAQAGHAMANTGAEAASGAGNLAHSAVDAVSDAVTGVARTILPPSLTGADKTKTRAPARKGTRREPDRDEDTEL